MAISDDSEYGKCYACFLVEGRDPIQIDPKPGSKWTLVIISFLLAMVMAVIARGCLVGE
jgi:hypothetical protein